MPIESGGRFVRARAGADALPGAAGSGYDVRCVRKRSRPAYAGGVTQSATSRTVRGAASSTSSSGGVRGRSCSASMGDTEAQERRRRAAIAPFLADGRPKPTRTCNDETGPGKEIAVIDGRLFAKTCDVFRGATRVSASSPMRRKADRHHSTRSGRGSSSGRSPENGPSRICEGPAAEATKRRGLLTGTSSDRTSARSLWPCGCSARQ